METFIWILVAFVGITIGYLSGRIDESRRYHITKKGKEALDDESK